MVCYKDSCPRKRLSYDTTSSEPLAAGQRNLLSRLSCAVSYRLGEVALTTFYSYDENGRVEWIVQKELGKKISYEYDLQGDVTKKSYQDLNNSTNNYYTWYEYDQVGRLAHVYSGSDLASRVEEARYNYTASGKVSREQLGTAQGVDYGYNERDWLTSVNNQNLTGESQLPSDKFGMQIGYNNISDIGVTLSAAPQYNGNISWVTYNISGVGYDGSPTTSSIVGYVYSYDNANRLLGANFGYKDNGVWNSTSICGENGISYDADGNIMALTRYACGAGALPPLLTLTSRPGGGTLIYSAVAIVASTSYVIPSGSNDTFEASASIRLQPGFRASAGSIFRARITSSPHSGNSGPMDQLAYHYQDGTNKLASVTDAVASDAYPSDLDSQPTNNYAYDANGNMLQDLGNQIAFVIYDISNLPVTVYKTDNIQMQYSYDANGNRFRKYDGIVYTYYVNGADGKTEAITLSNLPTTTYNLWGNDNVGKVVRNGTLLTRYYYLKDHLGSVRMTVDAAGSRKSWNDYYPFGLLIDGRNGVDGDADARYKFTSKEQDAETGYDYFGDRLFDPRSARWLTLDPVGSKYPSWSGYNYCLDNPIRNIDPDGDTVWVAVGSERVQYTPGMKYTGENSTIASIIATLNSTNSLTIGARVLSALISSGGNYTCTLGSGEHGDFERNVDGLGGMMNLDANWSGGIEEVAHEIFHAYMYDQGSGLSSISNEVQAYLYGAAVSLGLNVSPQPFSRTGTTYEDAMTSLISAGRFNMDIFSKAVKSFQSESAANYKGDYNRFPDVRPEEKYLVRSFYPLLR